MREIVAFGSEAGQHMSGRVPYEIRIDGEPLFSIDRLRSIFEVARIEPLPVDGLEYLAERLNCLAAVYFLGMEAPDFQAEYGRLTRALDCVVKWLDDRGMYASGNAAEAFVTLVREINATNIDPSGYGLNLSARAVNWKGKHYRNEGLDLASACANLLNLTRYLAQKPPYGLSNEGPLARFVAAIVTVITGESPTVAAVAKHLKGAHRKADAAR